MKKNIITLAFIASISLAFYVTSAFAETQEQCEARCENDENMDKYYEACKNAPIIEACVTGKIDNCKNGCIKPGVPKLPE